MDKIYFASNVEINSLHRVEGFPGSKVPKRADYDRYYALINKARGRKICTQSGVAV